MKKYLLLAFLAAATAQAQDPTLRNVSHQLDTIVKSVRDLQAVVARQNERIAVLEKENSALRATATAAQNSVSPAASTPIQPSGSSGAYVPDIGLVGDIVTTSTQQNEDLEGNDRMSLRELELVVGHDIDPYSRFDATITFSDQEDPAVEEAFVTYWGLPADTKARIGRMRPRIGLASPVHRDMLETVDEPLVIQNYIGLEGLYKTGLEVSNFLPLPWESVTHELIAGVVEGGTGEDGTIFGQSLRRETYYGRIKNFWEISGSSNAQLGGTFLVGSSNENAYANVHAVGTDLVFNHNFNSISKLTLKSEALFQNRQEGLDTESDSDFRHHPWGMYTVGEYRFAPRWAVGGRWDYVQPVELPTSGLRTADVGWSSYLTFYQSEFARWRFQYEHINFSGQPDDNRFFLQGTFAIGTHKHSLQ